MKKIICILISVLVFACDSENVGDCFQKSGALIKEEIRVDIFDKIVVNRDIELIIKEGATQKIVIETGDNLLNDVTATVVDKKLILTNSNTCNYVRDYGITKVYVTSPNIEEIRSSTQYDISSDGVLTYSHLTILSEDFNVSEAFSVGDFRLQISNTSFNVVFNKLSVCYISGETENLNVSFIVGASRFEGRGLIAQKAVVFNRGSNDIIVNPQQEIKGKISGVGNVISINKPAVIDVEQVYRGRLIFE